MTIFNSSKRTGVVCLAIAGLHGCDQETLSVPSNLTSPATDPQSSAPPNNATLKSNRNAKKTRPATTDIPACSYDPNQARLFKRYLRIKSSYLDFKLDNGEIDCSSYAVDVTDYKSIHVFTCEHNPIKNPPIRICRVHNDRITEVFQGLEKQLRDAEFRTNKDSNQKSKKESDYALFWHSQTIDNLPSNVKASLRFMGANWKTQPTWKSPVSTDGASGQGSLKIRGDDKALKSRLVRSGLFPHLAKTTSRMAWFLYGLVNPITVDILWVRHGLSCSNLLESVGKQSSWWNRLITYVDRAMPKEDGDPHLVGTEGMFAGHELQQQFQQPDLIVSSTLVRAMETAFVMFGNLIDESRPLIVAPHIKEKHHGYPWLHKDAGNLPLDSGPKGQRAKIQEFLDELNRRPRAKIQENPTAHNLRPYKANLIDYSKLNWKEMSSSTDMDKFYEWVVPEVRKINKKKKINKNHVVIYAVSHSNVLKDHFQQYCGDTKLNNNEAFNMKYTLWDSVLELVQVPTNKPSKKQCQRKKQSKGRSMQPWERYDAKQFDHCPNRFWNVESVIVSANGELDKAPDETGDVR